MPAAPEQLVFALLFSLALPSSAKPIDEGALNRAILPSLAKKLDGPNKQEALIELGTLGPYAKPAASALARHLDTPDLWERERIASILVRIGAYQDRAVPILASMLRSTQPIVSAPAFDALANAGESGVPYLPPMLAMLKARKISTYIEYDAMAARGPLAEAALPYYRSMIELNDETSPAHGFRVANMIAPNDPATLKAALNQMDRGSLERRCRLAHAYKDAGQAVPTAIANACEKGASTRSRKRSSKSAGSPVSGRLSSRQDKRREAT